MVRICPSCGHENGRHRTMCSQCRAPLHDVAETEAGMPPAPPSTRTCPFCAEQIQAAAVFCRFCHKDLPTPAAPGPEALNIQSTEAVPQEQRVTAGPTRRPALGGLLLVAGLSGLIVAPFWAFWVLWVGLALLFTAESRIVRWGGSFLLSVVLAAIVASALASGQRLETQVQRTTPTTSSAAVTTAAAAAPAPPASTTPPAPVSKWRGGASGASSMDDSPTVVFSLNAENSVQGWLKTERPVLFTRCAENTTDLILRTNLNFQPVLGEYDKARVRVRWDDSPPTSALWTESTDSEALFAPSAIALLRRMTNAERLRIEFTPFNSNPAVAEFDVRGFDQHIGQIARTCGWTP